MKRQGLPVAIAIAFCFFSFSSLAQRPLISEYDEVVKQANMEIDSSMQSGFLREMAVRYGIRGEYVMNVTVHKKGTVLSVFVVSSNSEDVKQQNLVKDIVKQMEFHFKVPKGKNYKFEHTFKFG